MDSWVSMCTCEAATGALVYVCDSRCARHSGVQSTVILAHAATRPAPMCVDAWSETCSSCLRGVVSALVVLSARLGLGTGSPRHRDSRRGLGTGSPRRGLGTGSRASACLQPGVLWIAHVTSVIFCELRSILYLLVSWRRMPSY